MMVQNGFIEYSLLEERLVLKQNSECVELPKGNIKKLIGRELSWEDEPVELK